MKIDAGVFWGDSLYRNSVRIKELQEQMELYEIDQMVLRPLKPFDYDYPQANARLAEAVGKEVRFLGFARVNPWERNAPAQVAAAKADGLVGLHLHPWEDNFVVDGSFMDDTLQAAQEAGFPVYISAGYPCVSEPLQILEIANRFPKVNFIATHGAQLDMSGLSFDDALLLAQQAPNVKFDLSGVYRRDFIERLIRTSGEDHVIFGSNYPYMDIALEIVRIEAAKISDEVKDKIYYGTIKNLLTR